MMSDFNLHMAVLLMLRLPTLQTLGQSPCDCVTTIVFFVFCPFKSTENMFVEKLNCSLECSLNKGIRYGPKDGLVCMGSL